MAEPGEPLSQRELEVLRCLAEGAANKEIAQRLNISPNTVKVHLRNAFTKLEATSRVEALTRAWQSGWLPAPTPGETTEAALAAVDEAENVDANDETLAPDAPSRALEPQPDAGRLRATRLTLLGLGIVVILVLAWLVVWRLPASRLAAEPPTPTASPDIPLGTSRWLRTQPLTAARSGMAVASLGPEIYVISGQDASGALTDRVEIYDTRRHAWRPAAPKPTPAGQAGAAVLGGQIYVVGGKLADGQVGAVVEAYSPTNDAWRSVAALPQPVAGGLALADNGLLYLFGGWNGRDYLTTTYVYDPNVDSWRPLGALSQARAYASGGVVGNSLFVVGGYDGQADLALCEHFTPASETWEACPAMLQGRGGAGAAVILNKLYVIGGGLAGAVPYAEFYDPATQAWQVLNLPMLNGPGRWTDLGVAAVETRIYVLGGVKEGSVSAEDYIFSPLFYQYIPAVGTGNQ